VTELRRAASEEDPIIYTPLTADAIAAARDIESGIDPWVAARNAAQRAADRTGVKVFAFAAALPKLCLPDELLHRSQLYLAASAARSKNESIIAVILFPTDVTSNP
jgi:hypothetical protein